MLFLLLIFFLSLPHPFSPLFIFPPTPLTPSLMALTDEKLQHELHSELSALAEREKLASKASDTDDRRPTTLEQEPTKTGWKPEGMEQKLETEVGRLKQAMESTDTSAHDARSFSPKGSPIDDSAYTHVHTPPVEQQPMHTRSPDTSTKMSEPVAKSPETTTKVPNSVRRFPIVSADISESVTMREKTSRRMKLEPRKSLLESTEVERGKDPLSLIQSDDEDFFRAMDYATSPSNSTGKLPRSSAATPTSSGKPVSSGEFQQPKEEDNSEPLDNPLYRDETSDFTTDTDSSQQHSGQGFSGMQASSEASALPSSSVSKTKRGSPVLSDKSPQLSRPRHRTTRVHTRSPLTNRKKRAELGYSFSAFSSFQYEEAKAAEIPPMSLPTTREERRSLEESDSDDLSFEENMEPEHFSLCAALEETHPKPMEVGRGLRKRTSSPSQRTGLGSFDEETDQVPPVESSPDPEADIWVTVPHPCRGHIHDICISNRLLWLVDSRSMVYCTDIKSKGKKWELIKHSMQQLSSSASGSIVWGVNRGNIYVRQGLDMSAVGQQWKNITKNTGLEQKIKHVSADEKGAWVVKTDGQIIFRKGVSRKQPQGRLWVEVGRAAGFNSVVACSGVVWATNTHGQLYYRDGITAQNPSGRKWVDMKAPCLNAICLTEGNVAWIIDVEGKMGFRCGVSKDQPVGKNPWWEVSVSTTVSHSVLPFNSLWQVMTSEGSQFLSSVSSLLQTHLPSQHRLLTVSASNKSGVCVLETGNKLHACWRSTTGYHYSSACKDGVFQLSTWITFGKGTTGLWVLREDGELYCVTPQEKFIRIECASTVQMMAVSPTAVWVVASDQLWSRQGMTENVPEGISWDFIELSPHLQKHKLKHVVCGKRAVWAIDSTGIPHFRFGVHAREPGTGMSPAWVPVDDISQPFQQITVSHDDWLVWACDENMNAYARVGVTQDFPVGRSWDPIPGQQVKQLCASCKKMYALTPNGNILCRYGITESNVQGNYWRQLPGNFIQISLGPGGQLLGLDSRGMILRQQTKSVTVCQDHELLQHQFEEELDPSWEIV